MTLVMKYVFLILGTRLVRSEEILCRAGFQSAADGCVACPNGTYSSGGQQSDCTTCPEGTTAQPGSEVCHEMCEPGYHLEDSAGCTSCPAGTYSPSGDSCITCPDGATSEPGSRSEVACVLQCSGLPPEWSNMGTDAEFPITSGTMIRVICNEGYVGDGGNSEVACVEGTTFVYNTLDLVECVATQEMGPDWTLLEQRRKKQYSFDPVTTTLQLHFTELQTLKNLRFSIVTRFYTNDSSLEAGNVRVFYQMFGKRVKKSRLTLSVRDIDSDNVMLYCQDWKTLQKTVPQTIIYDTTSESVVTVDSASTALFKESGCEGYEVWANLVESSSIAKIVIYLSDQNRNLDQSLLIHYRFLKEPLPTDPPTIPPTTPPVPTTTPVLTTTPQLDAITMPDMSLCSIYPMGVFNNFYNVAAYYDVSCHHVLAADFVGEEGAWFIYGKFDEYKGKKTLASITIFPGDKGAFEVQRGWLINVNGEKFQIMEGEERTVGETGCSVLFEKLHVKISCLLFPFAVYYDGLMSGHIQLPTTEPMKGRGSVGLCYDANSGSGRKNWQIGETEGECSISQGEVSRCESLPDACVAEEYCDEAGKVSCQELNCRNSTTPAADVHICSLHIARNMKCSLLGDATEGSSSSCPADVCLWKFKVLGAGCPQDTFFTGCPIENYLK